MAGARGGVHSPADDNRAVARRQHRVIAPVPSPEHFAEAKT
jgi:hypothetical protein